MESSGGGYEPKKSRIYLNGELLFESAIAAVGTVNNSKDVTIGAMPEYHR